MAVFRLARKAIPTLSQPQEGPHELNCGRRFVLLACRGEALDGRQLFRVLLIRQGGSARLHLSYATNNTTNGAAFFRLIRD